MPLTSVVVPFFNQEEIILRNLSSLAEAMASEWELILIDDASKDDSFRIALDWAKCALQYSPNLVRVRLLQNSKELFETECDSIGFQAATGKYLLEIQIDMKLYEHAFDLKLINALSAHNDIFMISGRGTTSLMECAIDFMATTNRYQGALAFPKLIIRIVLELTLIRRVAASLFRASKKMVQPIGSRSINLKEHSQTKICPSQAEFEITGNAGRLGAQIDFRLSESFQKLRKIWLGQTVMRGPLMIDRNLYSSIGGLDNDHFFLGNDDTDLAYRGYREKKLRCGFVPVGFDSPLDQGSTRRRSSTKTQIIKELKSFMIYRNRSSSALYKLGTSELWSSLPTPEVRSF